MQSAPKLSRKVNKDKKWKAVITPTIIFLENNGTQNCARHTAYTQNAEKVILFTDIIFTFSNDLKQFTVNRGG